MVTRVRGMILILNYEKMKQNFRIDIYIYYAAVAGKQQYNAILKNSIPNRCINELSHLRN